MFKILLIIIMLIQSLNPALEVFAREEKNQEQPAPEPNRQPSDREISNFVNDLIAFGTEGAMRIVKFIWQLFGKAFFKDYFVN